MTTICPVREEDWRAMRDIRLDALREAPGAFGSSYAREAVFTERCPQIQRDPRSK